MNPLFCYLVQFLIFNELLSLLITLDKAHFRKPGPIFITDLFHNVYTVPDPLGQKGQTETTNIVLTRVILYRKPTHITRLLLLSCEYRWSQLSLPTMQVSSSFITDAIMPKALIKFITALSGKINYNNQIAKKRISRQIYLLLHWLIIS